MNNLRWLTIIIFIIATIGTIIHHWQTSPPFTSLNELVFSFLLSIGREVAAVTLTILVLDYLMERREENRLRWQLTHDLASQDNNIALRAVTELSTRGWLMDGSLENANLHTANLTEANLANANLCHANLQGASLAGAELQNANLSETDLRGANLQGANLQGANLRDSNVTAEQLAQAHTIAEAILPDGFRRPT